MGFHPLGDHGNHHAKDSDCPRASFQDSIRRKDPLLIAIVKIGAKNRLTRAFDLGLHCLFPYMGFAISWAGCAASCLVEKLPDRFFLERDSKIASFDTVSGIKVEIAFCTCLQKLRHHAIMQLAMQIVGVKYF